MFEIGDFRIYGVAEEGARDDPQGIVLTPYEVNAYPWWADSTKALLGGMAEMDFENATVLDFGTGASCILALAAYRLGAKKVVAYDVVEEYVEIARQQVAANEFPITVVSEDDGNSYDIILANIGDAHLVGQLSKRGKHGIGSSKDGEILRW